MGLEKLKPIGELLPVKCTISGLQLYFETGYGTGTTNLQIERHDRWGGSTPSQFVLCEGPNSHPVTGTLIGPGSTILEPEGHCCARHIRVLGRLCEDISHFQV